MTETALVLCGGRSTRMGRDKASLPFGGDTLLARVVEILRGVVPDVVLVAREGQAVPDGVAVVRDPAEGLGPLAAIAAGLASLRTDRAFVAPCDAPLLAPALVRLLLEEAGTSLACVPRIEGRAMPVCAVYRREVAAVASALVTGGERRARALLGHVETRYVDETALRAVDPTLASFLDCDTREAYEAALEAAGLVVTVRVEIAGAWPGLRAHREVVEVRGANLGQAVRAVASANAGLLPEHPGRGWPGPGVAVVHRGEPAADPLTPLRAGDLVRLLRVRLDGDSGSA